MKKYQYGSTPGDKIDLSGLFSNPLFASFANNANQFSDKYSDALLPSLTSQYTKPTKVSIQEFANQEGLNKPLSIFSKKFWSLGKDYKAYTNQYNQDLDKYNNQIAGVKNNIAPLLSTFSVLAQGFKGQQNYDNSLLNETDLTETQGYQDGGDVNEMMQQDPWLKARANIESSNNQNAVSGAGAVGMFQITPIALKEYNRKYDSKYTWDQIKTNSAANAHVSQGLVKDVRKMIDSLDTNLDDFSKGVLTEMAYNYGPYRFKDKLKSKGKDVTLQDMLSDNSLPYETRNHGQKFIDYFSKNQVPEYIPQQQDNTRVNTYVPERHIKTFTGDPYEYIKDGDSYKFRKRDSTEDFRNINNAGKIELRRRKFQFGGTTQRDSIIHQAGKTMDYEALRGSAYGTGLSNYGNPNLGNNPSKDQAIAWYMQNIIPQVSHFQTAMEKGEAGDFLYNSGRDPRIYMLDQYLKSIGISEGLPNRSSYNIDVKSPEWKIKQIQFEQEWNKHRDSINKLPENDRRILLNKGRDFYYKNINKKPDGSPSDAYYNTWKGRIWNTNDYTPFNPNNPKFQFGGITALQNNVPQVLNTNVLPLKDTFLGPVDKTLLDKGMRKVYSKEGKQIGFINSQGQFAPIAKDKGFAFYQMNNDMIKALTNLAQLQQNIQQPIALKKDGGSIHINPEHKGEFTEYANRNGMSVQEAAHHVLAHSNDPHLRKQAQFAINASHFNHQLGGNINNTGYTPGTPTMNNDHNIIPSNSVTMKQTPFDVNAFPMYGGKLIGRPVIMKPGLNYYFPNADSVLEIPKEQTGGLVSTENGFYGRKGDPWLYKDNGDGTFTTVDTRRGKSFVVNKNSSAYNSIAALFGNNPIKMLSRPEQQLEQHASQEYIPQQIDSRISNTYIPKIKSLLPDYLPSSSNQYENIPTQTSIGGNNSSTPLGFFDTHPSWQVAMTIAPFLQGLGELGLLKRAGSSKKMLQAIKEYGKYFERDAINAPPSVVTRNANRLHQEGIRKVFSGGSPIYEKFGGMLNHLCQYRYGGLKYQMGDEVESQEEKNELNFSPIQTEKGERFYHLDGSITPTNARKLHKNMSNDEVTDIVPDGTFVASRDPLMRLSKKEADQIVLGNEAVKYQMGKKSKLPKDIKFGDIFTKRYHTPSELLDRIDKKFPISDKPNNIFTKLANEENLESRKQYADIVKYFTEVKKPMHLDVFKYGGVKRYQSGGVLGSVLGLLPQVFSLINGVGQTKNTLNDINSYETYNKGNLLNQMNVSQLANLAGYMSQDNTPELYNPDSVLTELSNPYNQAINSIPYRMELNNNMARSASNDAYSRLSNIDPRLAYSAASTLGANGLREANQSNLNLLNYRDQLRTSLGQQRANLIRESLLNRQSTLAQTRANRNQLNAGLFGNFGQIGSDYYSGLGNISNTALAARMGARGQQASFLTNMGYQLSNGLGTLASSISGLAKPNSIYPNTNQNFSGNLQGYKDAISGSRYPRIGELPSFTPRGGYYNNGTYLGE